MLNAFRHQRNSHWSLRRIARDFNECSTPFGIKGTLTLIGGHLLSGDFLCSTPFGIKGTLTIWKSSILRRSTGAQRLSASKELSRTFPARSPIRKGIVLNAFRHQRNSHADAFNQLFAGISVLNAFRHQRNSHVPKLPSGTLSRTCSTPFGIKGTLTARKYDTGQNFSKCSTPFGIKGTLTRYGAVGYQSTIMCSTPFGIKGTLTLCYHSSTNKNATCSTPFGIKGTLTLKLPTTIPALASAQRLSASKELSRRYNRCWRAGKIVLNAFRHQRNSHMNT